MPPRATGKIPEVICAVLRSGIRAVAKVPVVIFDASRLGMSAATSPLNAGNVAEPVAGPARMVFGFWIVQANVSVPFPVTGEFDTVNCVGVASPTLVTVPLFPAAGVFQYKLPEASVVSTLPPTIPDEGQV